MVNDLFLHEYLGRPENRVNVALFSMLQQSWFREWFLQSLGLPLDSIAYPPSNRNDCRPDLKVVDPARLNGAAVAWIEVELSKNTGQIKDYGEKLHPDPIRRLWGKRSHGGDLSLEEVAEFLNEQTGLDPQTAVNVQQLVELIREGLEGHSSSPGRSALTEEMRSHPLVTALGNHLGSRIRFDLGRSEPPNPGSFKADTTDTQNNQGFSLRVYSPKSSNRTLSVMSISGGRDRVYFPSLVKLEKYLLNCADQIGAYQAILRRMDLDITGLGMNQRPSLRLSTVLAHLGDLVPCLEGLADCCRS